MSNLKQSLNLQTMMETSKKLEFPRHRQPYGAVGRTLLYRLRLRSNRSGTGIADQQDKGGEYFK
ncbi:MAG: hypothetical protein ABW138_16305 [Candidatus Thiodiazotropha sp. 4PDIVS1]